MTPPLRCVIVLLLALLSACKAAGDIRPYKALPPIVPVLPTPAAATPGAVYQAGGELSLFADNKARNVGDILTITLLENTMAQSNANTNINKENTFEFGVPLFFGNEDSNNDFSASANAARGFNGNGRTAQSNRLQGEVTVTVIQRLSNGNLVVAGQKNIRLNQGNELVQIQGIVRPADIRQDNTILSSKVADAQIAYGGRGAMAQANAMGWLSRFFNSRLSPY